MKPAWSHLSLSFRNWDLRSASPRASYVRTQRGVVDAEVTARTGWGVNGTEPGAGGDDWRSNVSLSEDSDGPCGVTLRPRGVGLWVPPAEPDRTAERGGLVRVFPAGCYRERACCFAEAPAALPRVQHGPRLAAGIVVLGPGKQLAQAAGDEYPVAFDIPAAASVNTRAAAPAVPQVRYYGIGRVRGVAGGVGDFIYDQDGGAQRAEDDERPPRTGPLLRTASAW